MKPMNTRGAVAYSVNKPRENGKLISHNPPCLTVSDLSYRTPCGKMLLQHVSFVLEQGAVLAIAGPNGAGKTTLLKLLSNLDNKAIGEIYIGCQSLHSLSSEERAQMIAVVSQQSSPNNRLLVGDYVELGQIPIWSQYSLKEHRDSLKEVLALTNLTGLANKSIGQLSGGELQRAHIARALVQKPKLLFLDEPTNHLDPEAKGRMLSLVAALGITVVMVVHDLVLIPQFASHVALLKDTKLIAYGVTAEVLTPENVRHVFGVDYLLLPYKNRQIPTLDIQRTPILTVINKE